MQETPKIPDGSVPILDWFYRTYGPGWTLALIVTAVVVIVGFQVWHVRRRRQDVNVALEAKEQTIARLAEDNRMYRAVLFKSLGLSEKEIEKLTKPLTPKLSPPKGKKGKS